MNSCIYIDGITLWIFMGLFLLLVFGFILLGCSWLKDERELARLRAENEQLIDRQADAALARYRRRFQVPENKS